MSPTVRQTWPVEQGQVEASHGSRRTKLGARTSCSSTPRRHRPGTLAGWLTAAVRDAITDGRLPAGARLPATRLLAGQLGVSRGVVVEAYQRLTDEGLLSGRRGGGTTVLATAPTTAPVPSEAPRPACRSTCAPACPISPRSRGRPGSAPNAPRWPARRTPRSATATRAAPRELRTALATWLARSRGVRADPSAIVVVSGVAQGLALLAQVLGAARRHDRRVRGPGLARHPRPARTVGARARTGPGGRPRSGRRRARPTGSAPCSSPRRTSTRPAWCSPRRAGAPPPVGRGTAAW